MGDVRGMIRALDTYIKVSNDSTKIVPGHGPLATEADLVTFRNMLVTSTTASRNCTTKARPSKRWSR